MAIPAYDSHTHSKHSNDGSEEVAALCRAAAEKGIKGLAITDHCDIGEFFEENWRENMAALRDDIMSARELFGEKLQICFGVELGQALHDEPLARQIYTAFDYDFVLGSVHNIRGERDFFYKDENTSEKKRLVDCYFSELLELAQNGGFDSLAHLTLPYRYMGYGGDMPPVSGYEPLLREIFKALIQNGKALEINTSGLYRKARHGTMPGLWELKLYRECGGELVTIGSDAHRAGFVGGGFEEGRQLLLEAGFGYQAFYVGRKPVMHKL